MASAAVMPYKDMTSIKRIFKKKIDDDLIWKWADSLQPHQTSTYIEHYFFLPYVMSDRYRLMVTPPAPTRTLLTFFIRIRTIATRKAKTITAVGSQNEIVDWDTWRYTAKLALVE